MVRFLRVTRTGYFGRGGMFSAISGAVQGTGNWQGGSGALDEGTARGACPREHDKATHMP
jgi:hypothetical protein